MLVITRRIGERIKIDDDITIAIMDVRGCQVKIGIEAPKERTIHRLEIYNKIQSQKKEGVGVGCGTEVERAKRAD